MQVAYLESDWHLFNHLSNVLRASTLAGKMEAVSYDKAFSKRASHSSSTRWDLLNKKPWLVVVGPNIRAKGDPSKSSLPD